MCIHASPGVWALNPILTEAELPDPAEYRRLADLVPGAELAREVEHALDDAELVDAITGVERLTRWAAGVQAELVAEFARRRPGDEPASVSSEKVVPGSRWAPDELGLALERTRFESLPGRAVRRWRPRRRAYPPHDPGGPMSELRQVVAQALHDTRDGGTAVLTDRDGGAGLVQWISFGPDGHVIEVPDPARHRPGWFRRMRRRSGPDPVGLGEDRIRALERLGFTVGEHGPELSVGPDALGHDQLVTVIVGALEVVRIDGSRISVEVF